MADLEDGGFLYQPAHVCGTSAYRSSVSIFAQEIASQATLSIAIRNGFGANFPANNRVEITERAGNVRRKCRTDSAS